MSVTWKLRLASRLLGALLGLGMAGGPASAMEFATPSGKDGVRIVVARGLIVEGDAERFRVALQSVDRDSFGHKTVVLDSMGGVVGEAFAIAAFMDDDRVATVVRSGASCASACAQIVFLAGLHRIVDDGGRLGLHSCRTAVGGSPSLYCNDLIAQHAVAHGTIYGPIRAFMQMTGSGEVRWFDSGEADCWGLTRWPPGMGRGTQAGELPLCLLKGPPAKATVTRARDAQNPRPQRYE